jgi:hypothetical protein
VKFHATGDAAVRAGVDAIEAARKANGFSGLLHDVGLVQMSAIGRPRPIAAIETLVTRQGGWPHAPRAKAALRDRNLLWAVPMSAVTVVVDAHVHIHPCYRPDELLSHAHQNLSAAQGDALLLLMAETAGDDYFGAFHAAAHGQSGVQKLLPGQWKMRPTEEECSVLAVSGPRQLFLVSGRQVACREGLEVLLLGTTRRLPDGLPIRQVLTETASWGVPRVIPWGAGKWLFRRGRLLNELIAEFRDPLLFLGDEGGRPIFWTYPRHFARAARLGVRDLPGTDPLPFPHDVAKVGRMGFRIRMDFDRSRPAASLLSALREPGTALERFAVLESPLRFVRNQIGMQLRKRRLA